MKSRRLLRHAWLPVVCLLATIPVHAQVRPRPLIEGVIQDAFTILRDPSLRSDPKLRLRKLRDVADRAFDWEAMARSSLGAAWRPLNEAQRRDFVAVFKELLAQRYMDDIDRFQGSEQLRIAGANEEADLALVKTILLTSSREEIPIDYSLRLSEGRWRVEDVSIEGISLVNHYRKTFSRFLSSNSFDQLLKQLRDRLGDHGSR